MMNVCKAIMLFVLGVFLSISARTGDSENNPIFVYLGTDPVYLNCLHATLPAQNPYIYYRFRAGIYCPVLRLEVTGITGTPSLDLIMDTKNPVTGVWEVLDDDDGYDNRPAASFRMNEYTNDDHYVRIRMYTPGMLGTNGAVGVSLEVKCVNTDYYP